MSNSNATDFGLMIEIQRLETLTLCPKKNQTEKHCNSCMMTSSSVIVSSSATTSDSCSFFGDYIGMESCFDLDNSINFNYNEKVCVGGDRTKTKTKKKKIRRTEFPPPIPSLAQAENLHSHHMPWALKRYYTSDGRLILREEKVRHQEYFRAIRSNGRLTLQLVAPLINDEDDDDDQKARLIDVLDITNNNAEDDDHEKGQFVESSDNSMVNCSSIAETAPIENGSAAKCLNYASVRPNPSCFLGLPVPAIRPVRT